MGDPAANSLDETTLNPSNGWETALRVVLAGAIFLFSFPTLFTLGRAGRMEQIFSEMLSGAPLPVLTHVVLTHRGGLMVATVLLALTGIFVVFRARGRTPVIATALLCLVLLFGGFLLTVSAYFLPMIQIMTHLEAQT